MKRSMKRDSALSQTDNFNIYRIDTDNSQPFMKMLFKRYIILYFLITIFNTVHNNIIRDVLNIERDVKLMNGYPLDSLLNFTELATEHGYKSEEHTVITEDGYILTIFRITKGKNCQGPLRQPPVLLMHGLLLSSDAWLDSGPEAGLAYLISDACYDLWVGNVRGNYYGKMHVKYDPEKDIDFWQFSVNEIGKFDLPALIDYVANYTSSDMINYVGYSQGGSTFFIMCSERPDYCEDKVQLGIFLEPGSKNTYTKSVLFRLITNGFQVSEPFLTEIGIYQAFPLGGIVQQLAAYICKDYVLADTICRTVMSLIDSFHPGSVETKTIQDLMGHFPAGTSVMNMIWYNQALNVDEFQHFDYGAVENVEIYNSTEPPPYNLKATTTPSVVINGRNDFLAAPEDVDWLTSKLPNVIEHYIVDDPLWNHFDVPYSKLTSKDIMSKILDYLYQYSDEAYTNNDCK